MNAIILSIGDELVLGQTVDTNSAWISQQLAGVGCGVLAHQTVPDDQAAIADAIRLAAGRCDFLIVSGGIGPTEDDLTRQALADVMGVELEMNEIWLAKLVEFFKSRGREMPEINKVQAMIPRGATMIENTAGTAAGIEASISFDRFRTPPEPKVAAEYMERMFTESDFVAQQLAAKFYYEQQRILGIQSRKLGLVKTMRVFVIPGVPKEMKIMFTRSVLPHIGKATGGAVILSRTLHTFGLGESAIAEKLGELMNRDRNPSVGTTVANGFVSLRLNARFASREEAKEKLEETDAACRAALGDLIFGQDEETLPQVIARLLKRIPATESLGSLEARGDESSRALTVCTAESCTGGLLAKMLTDIPGSSSYFTQGWVTYSNKAKYERLGVSMEIINIHGAVSEPVVEAMAKNARRLAKSDFALSISGIAGPDGGSPTKPVGTVCIAPASPPPDARPHSALSTQNSALLTRTFNFPGDREAVRDRAAKMALTMLRFHLMGTPMPF